MKTILLFFSILLLTNAIEIPLTGSSRSDYSFAISGEKTTALSPNPFSTFAAPVYTANHQGPFWLLLDSGSTTVAIATASCTNTTGCSNSLSPRYTPSSSSIGNAFSVYGDGSRWVGDIVIDTLILNQTAQASLKLVAITSATDFFADNEYQGIFGIAYPNLAVAGTESFLNNYFTSFNDRQLVTLQLCNRGGILWIGSQVNTSLFAETSVKWTSIVARRYYGVQLQDIAFGSIYLGISSSQFSTIVDSGTTNLVLPNPIYNTLVSLITSNTYFQSIFPSDFFSNGDCVAIYTNRSQMNQHLPSLVIKLANVILTLDAVDSYIHQANIDSTNYYCPGLQNSDTEWIVMGWSVMNQYIVLFDWSASPNQVGFVKTCGCDDQARSCAFNASLTYANLSPLVTNNAMGKLVSIVIMLCILLLLLC